MRIPLSPHGLRELALYGGGLGLLGGGAAFAVPAAAPPLLFGALCVAAFFRDPGRRPEGPPEAAVSPADGKVTDIGVVEEPEFFGGPGLRIGIFLSVFDVHVNRVPLAGRAVLLRYRPGAFHDARKQGCRAENEAHFVGFEGARGPFAVRQVAGLVARRIVCSLQEGEEVERGARMGLIKFGSRTELWVPAGAPVKVEVEVGRKVKGGRTILLRYEA